MHIVSESLTHEKQFDCLEYSAVYSSFRPYPDIIQQDI